MKRIIARTISLLLVLSIFMAIPVFAEDAMTDTTKLDIEQYQFMRGANGLEAFTGDKNTQPLLPIDTAREKTLAFTIEKNKESVSLCENAVDNVVVVENVNHGTDSVSCYFRTILAVEHPSGLSDGVEIKLSRNETNYEWTAIDGCATVDGVQFKLYVAEYTKVLKPGDVAPASLYQLWLPADATSEDAALFGEGLDVMVISQCIEESMGETYSTALKHLGDVTALNHPFESEGWLMTLLRRVFTPNN